VPKRKEESPEKRLDSLGLAPFEKQRYRAA